MRHALILCCSSLLGACVVTKGEPPVNEGLAYFEVTFANAPELGSSVSIGS